MGVCENDNGMKDVFIECLVCRRRAIKLPTTATSRPLSLGKEAANDDDGEMSTKTHLAWLFAQAADQSMSIWLCIVTIIVVLDDDSLLSSISASQEDYYLARLHC